MTDCLVHVYGYGTGTALLQSHRHWEDVSDSDGQHGHSGQELVALARAVLPQVGHAALKYSLDGCCV